MRRVIAFLAVLAIIVPGSQALAQGMKWRGSGGWGPASPYGRMYDPKTTETVSGEVVKIERITPMRGMSSGVHVVLKTEKGEVSVHLGPAWYVENQDVKIEPKDTLKVTGSRVVVQERPALIAAEVSKGEEILKLRDSAGLPLWAGWRRGR